MLTSYSRAAAVVLTAANYGRQLPAPSHPRQAPLVETSGVEAVNHQRSLGDQNHAES